MDPPPITRLTPSKMTVGVPVTPYVRNAALDWEVVRLSPSWYSKTISLVGPSSPASLSMAASAAGQNSQPTLVNTSATTTRPVTADAVMLLLGVELFVAADVEVKLLVLFTFVVFAVDD